MRLNDTTKAAGKARLWLGVVIVAACAVGVLLLVSQSAVFPGRYQPVETPRLRLAFNSEVKMDAEGTLGSQTKKHDEGTGWAYWEYRPAGHGYGGAEPERRWPLLVFLHGAGESGHNLDEMISIGATGCPPVELAHGSAATILRESFVVVSPQTARGWGDAAAIAQFTGGLIASEELAIDETRVYCTGVSMGGAGAWVAGTTKLFAAIAPVCGAGSVPPASLAGVPVWAFHGANDIVVPVRVTDEMVEALQAARSSQPHGGANEVKYTRYDASPAPTGYKDYIGHASWIRAYAGPELWAWLLEHSTK